MLPKSLTPSQIAEKRKWFEARDKFLGITPPYVENIEEGIVLAKTSTEEDAKWLCDTFSVVPSDCEEVINILLDISYQKSTKPSIRARCLAYASCLRNEMEQPDDWLTEAASLGDPFAQAYIADIGGFENDDVATKTQKFSFAVQSALCYDQYGVSTLADQYVHGVVCPKNLEAAEYLYDLAIELGNTQAARTYGMLLWARRDNKTNLKAFTLMGKAWKVGCGYDFEHAASDFISHCFIGERHIVSPNVFPVLYAIGEAVNARPLIYQEVVYRGHRLPESDKPLVSLRQDRIRQIMFTAMLYKEWCQKAKMAVEMWLLISKRLGVCKDIRFLIGKLVWSTRGDADYALSKETLENIRNLH